MRACYLLLLNADENHNRYFRMTEHNGILETEIGRVGARPIKKKYPAQYWKQLYDRKIAEGYTDRTSSAIIQTKSEYAEIADTYVRELFHHLLSCARRAVKENFTVSYDAVSPEMLRDAQKILHEIDVNKNNIDLCRKLFKDEYIVIPRKMKTVEDMLPKSLEDVERLLICSQDLLDVMASQVQVSSDAAPSMTILDKFHLSARLCTDAENENIKKYMASESRPLFARAFRINNAVTDARFDAYCKAHSISEEDIHYLYHGSKNMNYFGIISNGLLLNPDAPITGKMFGHGIYLANRAKKSINYTDLVGSYWAGGHSHTAYLAVFKTAYKNAKHIQKWQHGMTSYTKKSIAPHDALFAHKGVDLVNDEIIVYDQAQVTLQYLIELQR